MLNQKVRSIVKNIGTIFVTAAVILRLSSSHIGGAFAEFTEAAFPWITMAVAIAVIIVYSGNSEEKP
ncbi:MAG: hypothetical protein IJN43_06285 [Ruminococcus sp.]|jgi:hypothetical protein|nr:hypothetical protein [Ruminococcus sp.]